MKNLLIVFLCYLFSIHVTAQKLDTIYSYQWLNNSWQLSDRFFNTYNSSCQVESDASQFFDTTSQSWGPPFINVYSYIKGNHIDTIVSSNGYRTIYTYGWYGAYWRILSVYHDEYYPLQDLYTYDDNGKLLEIVTQYWDTDPFAQEWVDGYIKHYIYNDDGTINNISEESWDTIFWTLTSRTTFTYNDAGKILTELHEWKDYYTSAWLKDSSTYTYHSKNKVANILTQSYKGETSSWINLYQQISTYSNGQLSQSIYQNWDTTNNTWINSSRSDYVYITDCVLPLTLLSFTAEKDNYNVILSWKTANEINTSRFVVQRSINAVEFNDAQTIPANPGSIIKTYSYTDKITDIKTTGKLYYRLQMVDNDGKSTLSNIISVTLENQLQFSIKPNPAKNYFVITPTTSAPLHVEVGIYDFSGRIILKQSTTINGEQKINISTLRKGAYMVTLKPDNNKVVIRKLLVE